MKARPASAFGAAPAKGRSAKTTTSKRKATAKATHAGLEPDSLPSEAKLLAFGSAFFPTLVGAIERAQTSVTLETYIFDFYGYGAKVATAVIEAAGRGVAVRVLVDGVGTPHVPPAWMARFVEMGVEFVQFEPFGRMGLLIPSSWRRLHRKLCVVDRRIAFCGGINILDDLYDPNHGELDAPRFDFALELSGPIVTVIADTMDLLWHRTKVAKSARAIRDRSPGSTREALQVLAKTALDQVKQPVFKGREHQTLQLVLRDNVRNRRNIERAYLSAIASARHDITLANAYFLPRRTLRQALARAVKRGVRVRVLSQGRYEYFMQFHAARAVYLSLLKSGVEIYEYTPSFLHAKVSVIDAGTPYSWATVGSSNLDPFSLLLAREANVVVRGSNMAQELQGVLDAAIQMHATPVHLEAYLNRPLLERWRNWVAYALMRGALFVTGNRY
jgi:cardiolipin synthase A/B